MNITTFFIKHPVIAIILNAMIIVVGFLCFDAISVREYPEIKLPSFVVTTHYPNANTELVESAVTNILEDQLAGVEGVETMTSQTRNGSCNIDLVFVEGTSVDRALIAIRDAIGLARSDLPRDIPEPVVQQKTKTDGPPFIAISLFSKTISFGDLTHYANLTLKNAFRSLKGVASAEIWGQPYTMAVTLDPQKLYAFGINADDVFTALEKNNASWPVGKFRNEVPVTLDLMLISPDDFENLLIKEDKGKPIFLKSIADVRLSTDTKKTRTKVNGQPGLIIAISRTNDANPLDVSRLVHEQVKHLQKILPGSMEIEVVLDQADFVRASLSNIQRSIFEAVLLVLAIVFLFLRNLRATLIPLITIPVSLIGSIILLKMFGFSINTITLLAMVLAIGLVVDDAIVVLENIARHHEKGLSPLQAAIEGSREIGFAIVAMTLTLASVYAPIAFIQGAIGQLFVEFAIALAGSVVISGIVALTLSPLMCARILKPEAHRLWPKIDDCIEWMETFYDKLLTKSLSSSKVVFFVTGGTFIAMAVLFAYLPSELAPKEDRSLMGVYLPRIPGKDINALEPFVKDIEETLKVLPESNGYLTFMGEWGASVCLTLKPHEDRSRSAAALVGVIRPQMQALPSIDAHPWSWDSGLPGIDDPQNGSELSLAVSTIGSYRDLLSELKKARKIIEEQKLFESVKQNLQLDNPGYSIFLDYNAVARLGLSSFQISKMIEVFFSGEQSLHFQKDSIRYQITLQGRSYPWTLDELYLTNAKGRRISLGTIAELRSSSTPKSLDHYNQMRVGYLSAELKSDQKMKAAMPQFWDLANQSLSPDLKKEWVGAAKMYTKSSMAMLLLFGMALVFIYAILAVQFENFLDPLIIMLTVPLGCFGALLTAWVFGQSLNIYTQIGLVTLIGLITKHGILIVEFANQLKGAGRTIEEAIREAARLRLRPVLMTTGAMIFGALPLILSSGAGIEARRSIGFVLVGGLAFGTCFTLLLLPKLYHAVKTLTLPKNLQYQ
jgi:multidrug efflux pump